jgi:transposase-like protein
MKPPPDPHYRRRFPAEIISQKVWLYHVFSLSLRDVELILAERGVCISYETIRRLCKRFGVNLRRLSAASSAAARCRAAPIASRHRTSPSAPLPWPAPITRTT